MHRHLIFDISTIIYNLLFQEKKTIIESNISVIKFFTLKHILFLIEKYLPNKVFLCFDSPKPWRKQIYQLYKENRKKIREKSSLETGGFVDWKLFFSVIDEFFNELKLNFPFFCYKIDNVEADDIIYFLVEKYLPQEDEKIIITKDTDFIQLFIRNKNLVIIDSFLNKEISHPNPIFYLEQKICMGDKSDNIPPIRPRMGKKTSELFIKNKELEKLLNEENEYYKIFNTYKSEEMNNYERNRKLIDFLLIPNDIILKIENSIKHYENCNNFNYFNYFIKQKYRIFIEDISKIRQTLNLLEKYYKN